MQYSINRSGKKIILTDEEIEIILIQKDYSDFKAAFCEVAPEELFPFYLYMAKGKTKAFEKIDEDLLKRVMEMCGYETSKKTESDNLDKINLEFLDDEEES